MPEKEPPHFIGQGRATIVAIPIKVAKDISVEFACTQVVVWACAPNGEQHVVTYGADLVSKRLAAESGNRVKQAAGWPEEMCKAVPAILGKMEAAFAAARAVASGPTYPNVDELKRLKDAIDDFDIFYKAIG